MRIIFFILLSFNVNAQLQINGTGTTVHINGTGTTLTINGVPNGYGSAESGDITFTDADFHLSFPGFAGTNFTHRSTAGYVEFWTAETVMDIKVGGNWSTASSTYDEQSDCEVLVNGVYNQSVRLTADDVTQEIEITLPPGNKLVRLINGYTANAGADIKKQDAGYIDSARNKARDSVVALIGVCSINYKSVIVATRISSPLG